MTSIAIRQTVFLCVLFLALSFSVQAAEDFVVYKSPTCGCCLKWVDHMAEYGFTSEVSHPADLNDVKQGLGVSAQSASCHTAVSQQGYVFEGHVPAKYIQLFLADPPENALGLTVPGMPLGSPGMEMDDRFNPYKVYQLNTDGTMQVYARVNEQSEQY